MNKDLRNIEYTIPENVIKHLMLYSSQQNGDNNGIKRAKTLIQDGKVNYNQLKRILHDLKNHSQDADNLKYNLYGGKPMEDWGWRMLSNDRNLLQTRKESGERVRNITGLGKNQHNKTHRKKPTFVAPSNVFKSNSDVSSTSSILPSMKLFEEINRIKELMN